MNKLWHYSVPCVILIRHLPLYLYAWFPTRVYLPSVYPKGYVALVAIAGISNIYRLCVESLRFICGSGTRRFHLRLSGLQMGRGSSPIVRIPQWWSRRWPSEDAPHQQNVALCIPSLHVHAFPLRVPLMPAFRYDLNWGLLTCLTFIMYQEYLVIVKWWFCKPDRESVSILAEWICLSRRVKIFDFNSLFISTLLHHRWHYSASREYCHGSLIQIWLRTFNRPSCKTRKEINKTCLVCWTDTSLSEL